MLSIRQHHTVLVSDLYEFGNWLGQSQSGDRDLMLSVPKSYCYTGSPGVTRLLLFVHFQVYKSKTVNFSHKGYFQDTYACFDIIYV